MREQIAHSCFQSLLPGWSIPDSSSQHNLQKALDCHQFRALFSSSSIHDCAHLNSTFSKFTSAWLQAIPNPNLGLSLVAPEFICALRYWLGIPFFDASHLYSCSSTLDSHGDHLLGCGHGPLRICHHDAICHIVFQVLLQDNSQVRQEQRLFGSSATRPGDIFHPDFADGRPTYFNLPVCNSSQPQFLNMASSAAGELAKDLKYESDFLLGGGVFYPLVVESLGLWTSSSVSLLCCIAAHTTFCGGISPTTAFHNLIQQLSIKLWSYNAKMILRHISLLPSSALEDSCLDHSSVMFFPGFQEDQVCDADVDSSISNDHSCSNSVHSFVANVSCPEDSSHSMVSPSSPLCTPMASNQVSYSVAITNRFSSLTIEHDYPSENGPSLKS